MGHRRHTIVLRNSAIEPPPYDRCLRQCRDGTPLLLSLALSLTMMPRRPAKPISLASHTITVGSGKGGVGKSTVSLNLALALRENGATVGLLDADFYGPNIPLMVGLKRDRWQEQWTIAERGPDDSAISPIDRHGLRIMSAGFIIAEDQPFIVDGPTAYFFVQQLLHRVSWGDLDYLVVDLPPGSTDVSQHLFRQLVVSGALIVVGPQDVAHLDGRKALQMFRQAEIPLLGAIENMSNLVCPHCDQLIDVFPHVPEDRSIWRQDVANLGTIPLDPTVSHSGDRGIPLLVDRPDSRQSEAFRRLAHQVTVRLAGLT